MEIVLQIISEPLFFAYYDLFESLFEDKQLKKRQEYLLKISCLIVSLISVFLVLIGAFWVSDIEPFRTCGVIFLIIGGVFLSAHILIGLFAGTNHFVKEKREEETSLYNDESEEKITPQIYYIDANNGDDDKL